ncbi:MULTISPECIES: pyridoxal phosphate-dependent aminotransferase [unclassified Frigoribacterium]|uniref:pyridoxal phosphate-dependent aminotransferase n=1 Tax=unclassified Frigoribacterium TaxID=2627005 RepID=UPI001565516E|nr:MULTISPECIES: aminotransferase class I/II-fold pyridoxal phosphate-dependent enzyme [unclassified Frigoribacterium]NQW86149.1 aminotransferase class I/II-fold pyridoxal phosphate-dependent enzyme [Frigoribacterium sp. VKM Ac-2860]NQX07481.1 aminotransferase class I/II-fold pyridoxal phosphate-dependent enzyme [Frigoribacterium sp. VKM Ac-2859]
MPQLAPHMATVPASGIRRVYELAAQLDGVDMLVVGEPDVPVARHIADAARRAWADDRTDYTPNGGIPALREALVDKLARENDVHVDLEQVWVTVGGTQALHQTMGLLLAAGDEVLVPDPGYTTFTMNAHMLDAVPVPYTLAPELGFHPDLDELENLVGDRTRALIVNSPSNPLGVVYPEETLRRLLDFARRHDLWVISDEVYEYFTYGPKHVSLASLDGDDRVFSVFSMSKTYAMTGVRVGYLVTPKGLAETMRTVQEAAISCVAEPDQHAALAAVVGDHQPVADAREHYRSNLDLATTLLDERGIRYLEPTGAFYLWIDVSHASQGDVAAWAERFLLSERVAVAPGSAFGRSGEGWIRVCLASSPEVITRGLGKLPAPGDPR